MYTMFRMLQDLYIDLDGTRQHEDMAIPAITSAMALASAILLFFSRLKATGREYVGNHQVSIISMVGLFGLVWTLRYVICFVALFFAENSIMV